MALDAGTTSNRCILFNEKGQMCSVAQKEFTQYFPQPGWVEHDAEEIYSNMIEAIRTLIGMSDEPSERSNAQFSLCLTNQRETAVVWNKPNIIAYLSR